MSSFQSLNIIDPILRALQKEAYETPTPIQAQAIPPLLESRDLLGCAQTGTGKTAAFAIPILQRLTATKPQGQPRRIRALILSPTRELAAQIGDSFGAYGRYLGLRNTVIFGGVSQVPQAARLKAGVDILVATPGRLLDLMGQRLINLQHVEYFVLDEADRMLDMGFLHDVEKVIAQLPTQRQTMLFSATMPPAIEALTKSLLRDPVKVAVTPVSSTVDTIDQSVYFVNKQNKINLLIHLLKSPVIVSALVFSRTKHGADKIARKLTQAGVAADVIHSNKSQNARQAALGRFKEGHARVLVATDIVARGIDIDELSHVINFDLPEVPEAYVHRIGRTARAGLTGTAISFCDETEKKLLVQIEKLTGQKVPVVSDHPYPLTVSHDAQQPAPTHGRQSMRGGQTARSGQASRSGQSTRQPRGFASRQSSGFSSRQSSKPADRQSFKSTDREPLTGTRLASKPAARQTEQPAPKSSNTPKPASNGRYNIPSKNKNTENKSKYNV